jgi:3-methyladenine DNA glycosylase Mpg
MWGERDIVKFNWNQSGMPVSLVSRLGRKSTVAEFKSVLNDAQNPRIGIAYASKRDQNRKWRFTLRPEGRSLARRVF